MTKIRYRFFSIVSILAVLLTQFGLHPASAAANFTVNSTADVVDANPGDGVCETATPGECTLRAAIQEANALPDDDTITLPAGTFTLTLAGAGENASATGDLDITDGVTITGAGMGATIIDGNDLDRIFHVRTASLTISNLTLRNGLASPGGALLVDIYASISRVAFEDNQSTAVISDGSGGGVFINAEAGADISQSRFTGNFAHYGGGAVASTFTNSFTITDSTFDGNTSVFGGGALYPNGDYMLVENSTFTDNSADTGGAIHSNADLVEINNSTFAGNSAVNHGAVDSRVGLVVINNSTFVGNVASGKGDTIGSQSYGAGGKLQVRNSILYGTTTDVCDTFYGAVQNLGNNLTWPSGSNCPGTQADPLLSPLADNGGHTQTMAIGLGSPAIDAGNNSTCTTNDQRGVTRPQGAVCDIGAFEFEYSSTNIFYVTNVNDSGAGSLRQAIIDANSTANGVDGPDEIRFNIPGAGVQTIAPASALPTITDPVIIDGTTQPGASCSAWPPTLLIELDGSNTSLAYGLDFGFFSADGSTVRGLVVNRFYIGLNGAYTSDITIECNFIGTNASGTVAAGNTLAGIYFQQDSDNNVIGGPLNTQRNLISGNGTFQIHFPNFSNSTTAPSNNLIQNNYIGTDVSGMVSLGGGFFAIDMYGTDAFEILGNLISGNSGYGIYISGDANRPSGNHIIQGNKIGVDATGAGSLGNGGPGYPYGVALEFSQDDVIGGDGEEEANIIANHPGAGINLSENVQGARILGNSIFDNTNLDVDLGGDGVTFNHAGTIAGPNNYQNYPVLTLATSDNATTRVVGSLASDANESYKIDVFANETCHPSFFGGGKTYLGSFDVTTNASGVATFDKLLSTGTLEPNGITTTATGADGTSEFSYCRPVSTLNLNWVQAQSVSGSSSTQQFITDRFQEKWFKVSVQPGATINVTLTGLPGSAVSLHRDPLPVYNNLILPQNAAVLSAAVADTAFLPSGSLPSGSLPSGSLPSGSLPSGSLPSGSLPTGYLPSGSLPSGSLPSGSLPSGSLPSGSLPSGSLPSGSLPSGSLPSGSLPSGSLPSGSLPSGSLPSGSLPSGSLPSGSLPSGSLDAYASAARRSLMGISMDPYATIQTIERNTYDLQEDLYVRVVGPYNLETPFTLDVTVTGGVCGAVQQVPSGLPAISGLSLPSDLQTLILTDSSRMHGTTAEVADALADLERLAFRPDVNGKVIDLANTGAYPRVAFANTQADANLPCAFAKNSVANEIKNVIDAYRAANPGVEYLVLAGGADVIPFFQVQDVSGLAFEREYIVPVAPSTASEAGLMTNLVQGQDGYGSDVEFMQAGHTLAFPNLSVGRLVDEAADISAAVDAYIQTNGVIVPNSTLVTGYDFVGDAAVAIQAEFDAGTNSNADTLIQLPGLPPTDPTAWSANDMRAKLLDGDFDIVMLSGHFSAGSLLAADYATELSAAEIAASSTDFNGILFLALGCHSGYAIPNGDLLPGISPDPDWAKAFLRKGAAGYVSATGYAYGDTELTEYGERLFLLMAQQMRTGTGPVSVGDAFVKAKQQYLAETAQLTGIDHKTIVEMTLYGLPMMKVDMPGTRITPPFGGSIVGTPDPVPGAGFGLTSSVVVLNPATATQTKQLQNLSDNSTVTTTYLTGANGVVVNPFEPILPKFIYDVSANGKVLRGVAFRGGIYTDLNGIIPLTSSPTTEISTAHLSYYASAFYPTQTWSSNFSNTVTGGNTGLILFPAQFRSSAPGAIDGTLRKFDQLNLQLFYLPSNWTDAGSPSTTKAAAVSGAPVIQGASAFENGSDITFNVNAVAEGSAGIQAVWVLYTGKPGTPHYGAWTPLDLSKNASDSNLWEGTLTLQSGESAQDILFMVQAVGGAGLTTLGTNLGAFYNITPENATQLPPPAHTTLSLQSPPSNGTYLQASTFDLLLQSNGQPLAGQLVTLDIGGQQASRVTNSSGEATLSLNLVVRPGNYTAQASFRGNTDYLASNATSPFTVNKDTTSVMVTPASENILVDQPTPFVAVVRDSSGRALGGRSVIFIVHNSTERFSASVIADYLGNARLGTVNLPPGTYTVDAYFNGIIPVNEGNPLVLNDDYYQSSSALSASLKLISDGDPPTITAAATKADSTPYTAGQWTNQDVTVRFTCEDSGSGVASCPADLVYSTDGEFNAEGTATDNANNIAIAAFGPIKIDKTAPTLTASVSPNPVYLNGTASVTFNATDAGSGVATQNCGTPSTNTVGTKTVACNATDNAGNITTLSVPYQVVFNFTGFFAPVDNPPFVNQMNSGRAVPVKFSLGGNHGLSVIMPGYPYSQKVQCTSFNPIDNVEETVTAGSSILTYDSSTGRYSYIWKTDKSWSGTCRQFVIRFTDGQIHILNFSFTR